MQRVLALILAAGLAAVATAGEQHPVKQVIALVKDLDEKAVADGKAEQATYEKFEAWAAKSIKDLKKAVEAGTSKVEELELQAEAKKKETEVLADQISQVESEVTALAASSKTAAADRAEAVKLHEASVADLTTTIDAISQAVEGLEAPAGPSKSQTKAAQLLRLPLVLETLSEDQEVLLLSLAEEKGAQPEEKAYESKTGSVVDLLKKLKQDFEDKKANAKIVEVQAASEYDLAKAARDSTLASATASKGQKEQSRADADAALVSLGATLKSTKADLEGDSKSLKDTELMVKLKADEFKQRKEMREKEHKAMLEGVSILEQVAGVRTAPPAGLVQVSVSPDQAKDRLELVLEKVRQRAQKASFKDIQDLVERAKGEPADDSLAKELDLTIEKQIWKLKDDQLADDKEKQWCDQEIDKTKTEKEFKSAEMETLNDKITASQASVVALVGEIDEAKTSIAQIKQDMHEGLLLREETKNENKLAVEDAQDAQAAIGKAIATLQSFYKDASDSAAILLQEHQPKMWGDSGYTGNSGGSAVIAVLEESAANFARMEADTQAQEAADDEQYATKLREDKEEVARKETEVELKTQEKLRLTEKADAQVKSLKLTDRQVASVSNYLEEIEQKCTGETTHAERKAARDAEIADLEKSRVEVAEALGAPAPKAAEAPQLAAVSSHGPASGFLAPVRAVRQ
eukprot:gb/GFBE01019928.1/.p1 GENE.gb/GFBE01019928.1/~~gb/GFBE01019928.1/.p1  ORF type:complete len:691 (+),score=275.18 gb/GFBE01019928.1/:1-2073(+)